MIEPMNVRDLLTVAYATFAIFGGLYVLSSLLLLAGYRKREKRKRKADR